ncbi:hypothetical protein STENM327S_06645 [Streptomyces tendae]
MSTVAFLNIGMHGHVNPTLPVVSELVKRGHKVTYHIWPSFRAAIENTGAEVRLYSGGAPPLPDPVTPLTLLEALAGTAVRLLPTVLAELRDIGPDLIVHDNTCPWGAVAARELGVPAVVVHHVRVNRSAQPHQRLLGSADAGDGEAPSPAGRRAQPPGAAPALRHARRAPGRPVGHPPAPQPRLHLTGVPARRRGLRHGLPLRRPQHRRPPG